VSAQPRDGEPPTRQQVTRLLAAAGRGDEQAIEQLLPLLYDELRARAGALMATERRNHTLQRTALVHEAYLKLMGPGASYQSRLHFFNAAALAMRRILVNHAVHRGTRKRGGLRARVDLDDLDVADPRPEDSMDWVGLDEALQRLEAESPRQHQVVMLRFFSGRTEPEIAQMLDISESTVRRDWATARVWLCWAMQQE
jgi:RNA polymerase sigma factor (TIGR02999 family)